MILRLDDCAVNWADMYRLSIQSLIDFTGDTIGCDALFRQHRFDVILDVSFFKRLVCLDASDRALGDTVGVHRGLSTITGLEPGIRESFLAGVEFFAGQADCASHVASITQLSRVMGSYFVGRRRPGFAGVKPLRLMVLTEFLHAMIVPIGIYWG